MAMTIKDLKDEIRKQNPNLSDKEIEFMPIYLLNSLNGAAIAHVTQDMIQVRGIRFRGQIIDNHVLIRF